MDRYETRQGFLPGLFGRKNTPRSASSTSATEKMTPKPASFVTKVPAGPRNHFIAMASEFVGTFMFLFFAFAGTQVANTPATTAGSQSTEIPQGPNPIGLLYISLAFSFSLAVNAWIFFRVSGGLFNPAVTLALCLVGAIPFSRGAFVFIAQMLGAMASAGVVKGLFPGPLAVTTTLAGGTSLVQGVFIEMFLTAQLIFTILMLAVEKHKATFLAPIGIGLALFIAEIAGVYYTGGSLNPARSFGPCVANKTFPSDHWVYWVGPFLGALLASGFYWFIKAVEFQTVNPGQDFDDLEAHAFDPSSDLSRPVVSPNAVVDRSATQDLAAINSNDAPRNSSLGSQERSRSRGVASMGDVLDERQRTGSRNQLTDQSRNEPNRYSRGEPNRYSQEQPRYDQNRYSQEQPRYDQNAYSQDQSRYDHNRMTQEPTHSVPAGPTTNQNRTRGTSGNHEGIYNSVTVQSGADEPPRGPPRRY